MAESNLVDTIVAAILDDIAAERLKPGQALEPEAEVGVSFGVSRLTVREAFRVLRSQGVLTSARGVGTFVSPVSEWRSLQSVVKVLSQRGLGAEPSVHLLELRRMIETGSAAQAAVHRSAMDIEKLESNLNRMREALEASDVETLVQVDLDFHEIILKATDNPLVPATMHQLSPLMIQDRAQALSLQAIREHAVAHHELIAKMILEQNAEGARKAMDEHLLQTIEDIRTLFSAEPVDV